MKKVIHSLMALAAVACLSGCATAYAPRAGGPLAPELGAGAGNMTEVRPDRMLVWTARLGLEVWNVSNAVHVATALAERQGGFVERKSDDGEASASLTLRIPARRFKTAVSSLEMLGTVTSRSIEGDDVTEQSIDVDSRLRNKVVLRERLKQLLEKATAIKDILAIETELNRVQADIDSMEGRIKSLKGQVDFATVTLRLERRPILGPLGYVFKGLWWGVEKLFVIRD